MPDENPTIDWQQRALEAENKLATLAETLKQTQEALAGVKRAHEIDMALVGAEAVDMETARLLTESALAHGETQDVQKVVADLKQRKPFLFRPRRAPASSMSASGRGRRWMRWRSAPAPPETAARCWSTCAPSARADFPFAPLSKEHP